MCSPFPSFLKPPGLNVPDMIVLDDLSPVSSSQTGYAILRPFLKKQGREISRVLGDGNCLFRSISKAICNTEDYHLHLRKAIAEFEGENDTLFRPIHEAVHQTQFSTHLKNVKKQYIWGTNTEITAIATLLQVEVYVATDNYRPGVPMWIRYLPKPVSLLTNASLPYLSKHNVSVSHNCDWIELTHVNSIHFDTTRPLKGSTLTRPELEGSTDTVLCIL